MWGGYLLVILCYFYSPSSQTTKVTMLHPTKWGITALLLLSRWTVALPASSDALSPSADIQARQATDEDNHWVVTWTSMPQLVEPNNMPPSPYVRPPNPSQTSHK